MRFKIRTSETQTKHEEICTSVSWCTSNEVTRYPFYNLVLEKTMFYTNGMSIPTKIPNGWIWILMLEIMIGYL